MTPLIRSAVGAPTLASDRAVTARRSRLRCSLSACTAEGVVTEFAAACCGASALTAWALYLGAGKWLLGLLGALPFLAQLVQVPIAYVTSWMGVMRATIAGIAASRQLYFSIMLLPLLPVGSGARAALLLAVAALAAVLNVLGGNGWSAWIGHLVPPALRGRYLGRRTSLCTLASAIAALLTGAVLDGGRRLGEVGLSLGVLAAIVGVAGVVCAVLLARMHLPGTAATPPSPSFADAIEPLADRRARGVLAYQAVWGAATGLASSFYALFMIDKLHLGFVGVTLHAVTTSLARTTLSPFWGRTMDRFGVRPVLVASATGLCLMSLSWIFVTPSCVWILAVDAVVAGALDAGQMLGSTMLPLRVSPRERLPFYLSAFGMASGLAFGLASIAGGVFVSALPDRVHVLGASPSSYAPLFAAASALRGLAALLGARIREPGARPVRDIVAAVLGRAAPRSELRACMYPSQLPPAERVA
jgi:hypothetical protein